MSNKISRFNSLRKFFDKLDETIKSFNDPSQWQGLSSSDVYSLCLMKPNEMSIAGMKDTQLLGKLDKEDISDLLKDTTSPQLRHALIMNDSVALKISSALIDSLASKNNPILNNLLLQQPLLLEKISNQALLNIINYADTTTCDVIIHSALIRQRLNEDMLTSLACKHDVNNDETRINTLLTTEQIKLASFEEKMNVFNILINIPKTCRLVIYKRLLADASIKKISDYTNLKEILMCFYDQTSTLEQMKELNEITETILTDDILVSKKPYDTLTLLYILYKNDISKLAEMLSRCPSILKYCTSDELKKLCQLDERLLSVIFNNKDLINQLKINYIYFILIRDAENQVQNNLTNRILREVSQNQIVTPLYRDIYNRLVADCTPFELASLLIACPLEAEQLIRKHTSENINPIINKLDDTQLERMMYVCPRTVQETIWTNTLLKPMIENLQLEPSLQKSFKQLHKYMLYKTFNSTLPDQKPDVHQDHIISKSSGILNKKGVCAGIIMDAIRAHMEHPGLNYRYMETKMKRALNENEMDLLGRSYCDRLEYFYEKFNQANIRDGLVKQHLTHDIEDANEDSLHTFVDELIKNCIDSPKNKFVHIDSPNHAMALIAKKDKYNNTILLFIDPNLGEIRLDSDSEEAKKELCNYLIPYSNKTSHTLSAYSLPEDFYQKPQAFQKKPWR